MVALVASVCLRDRDDVVRSRHRVTDEELRAQVFALQEERQVKVPVSPATPKVGCCGRRTREPQKRNVVACGACRCEMSTPVNLPCDHPCCLDCAVGLERCGICSRFYADQSYTLGFLAGPTSSPPPRVRSFNDRLPVKSFARTRSITPGDFLTHAKTHGFYSARGQK